MTESTRLLVFADDILRHALSYLSFRDLISFSETSSKCNRIVFDSNARSLNEAWRTALSEAVPGERHRFEGISHDAWPSVRLCERKNGSTLCVGFMPTPMMRCSPRAVHDDIALFRAEKAIQAILERVDPTRRLISRHKPHFSSVARYPLALLVRALAIKVMSVNYGKRSCWMAAR